MQLWKLDGTPLNTLKGHSDNVLSVSFSHDGKFIASASAYEVILWNRKGKGTLLKNFSSFGTRKVGFSPDGKTIAAISSDRNLSSGSNTKVSVWSFELDNLLERGCNQVRDYLKNNRKMEKSDRTLCDDIPPQK